MMNGSNLVVVRRSVPVPDSAAFGVSEPRTDFELIRRMISGSYAPAGKPVPGWAAALLGRADAASAAIGAWQARNEAGQIFTTGEDIAFRLLPLLAASGWKGRLFSVVHASHSRKWQLAARAIGTSRVGAYFVVASAQRDALVKGAGLPAGKVHFIYDSVDAAFFDPALTQASDGEAYVFACGLENRDYDTLAAAAPLVGMRIRVQASGYFPTAGKDDEAAPSNFEVNRTRLSYKDLRARYAGATFVVVPLRSVPYAAGVNGLLEAMAMGKAVIVTDSPGLTDYTGVPSLVKVPPADPKRLADAIKALQHDPAGCAEMGRANRDWILSHATVDAYASTIAGHMSRTG